MILGRLANTVLFLLVSLASAQAADHDAAAKTANVSGKWRIAWDVRLGTVRGVLVLKQKADNLSGTFQEYGKSYPLSGSVRGRAVTLVVPFTGRYPYTIEFNGTVEGKKISGTSHSKDGGEVFLGHAGEVDEPQRPWTATRGLKNPNASPGKPPDDDDDDDRRRPYLTNAKE
jgi:hypothetical protein